ncbi:hypothetical protein [Sorangium cellulosum]|nr:hypothetical protein [Sorangium cellulosum]
MMTSAKRMLIIGLKREPLDSGVAALRAQGYAAVGAVGPAAAAEFDARDFDLITIGGGVDAAPRAELKARFKAQNKDVMLLDVYRPIAMQQIAWALRRSSVEGELASAFSVSEGEDGLVANATILRDCRLRLDIYRYPGSSTEPEVVRVVEASVTPGAHAFPFDEALARDGFMAVLTLNGEEHHLHRLGGQPR